MRVHEQRSLDDARDCFERGACEESEATRIVRIIRSAFDVDAFAIEISRVVDKDHGRPAGSVGVAEKSHQFAARADVNGDLGSDLLEILCDLAYRAVQRNDDEDIESLSRLNVGESLNRLGESTRARVGRELRCEVDYRGRFARR